MNIDKLFEYISYAHHHKYHLLNVIQNIKKTHFLFGLFKFVTLMSKQTLFVPRISTLLKCKF